MKVYIVISSEGVVVPKKNKLATIYHSVSYIYVKIYLIYFEAELEINFPGGGWLDYLKLRPTQLNFK